MRLLLAFIFFIGSYSLTAQNTMWNVGDTLPNFAYKGQFAKPYQLKELKGSYVLVNFWASWNEESRKSQIDLIESYARFKDKRFKNGRKFYIISVSLDETDEIWTLALKKDNLPWKGHYCDYQSWKSELLGKLKIDQIPANYLLNPSGIIIARNVKKEQLEELLKGL
jgi:peroxiredoxin